MRALALVLLGAACAGAAPRPVAPQLAPTPLVAAGGAASPTTLAALAAGRPAVVELFATWCDVCRRQAPELAALDARLGGRALVVGVVLGERPVALDGWGITYPLLFDPELRFADAQGVRSVPTLLVVDGDGRVRHAGRTLDDAARKALDDLLAVAARE